MQWTSLNDLREKFLSFFESKGHLRLPSFPLVPINDKSLLLINSGMAPLKKYFTGEEEPPCHRVATCQKCIRTPDLERVGKTARHGTYFEMLGNFSFGDYFKNEAIPWAWEFLTECLEIPEDKLWPSVYESDDEAYNIWKDVIGVPEERIVKLGKEDNFWEHGTGPCGPCSEIYFDRGEKYGCGSPDCKPGCDCDRYMEIWNNVFSQFNNMGDGTYTELKTKNIDTGMGLERLACIFQDVDNLFEVDTIKNIMLHLSEISGIEYKSDPAKDVSMRVITDHIRSTTFMIADGVMPSNEGRGYVLRRLIRRAARHGRLLNINRLFLSELCETVIKENVSAYPELSEKRDFIKKVLSVEEENFAKTIDQGLKLLDDITAAAATKTICGDDAFKLYDTYGFPLDLTRDILEEKGFTVDEARFDELMLEQRERARNSRKASDTNAWKGETNVLSDISECEFCGYLNDIAEAKIIAIVKNGDRVDNAYENDEVLIITDITCFYAESGGQIGDTGVISSNNCKINVVDTVKNQAKLTTHVCRIESGMISVGDKVQLSIDSEKRMAIRRNHTSAHLLQAGLRSVLGTHVEQAGQLVNERTVRFDFTHFSALTEEEISKVENFVNSAIFAGIDVVNKEMPINEAKAMGAMALFGEKYGDIVRVVAINDTSIELCGGTHIDNTAKIGMFKIISESSVASGVRRIEAVCGTNILGLINKYENIISQAGAAIKCSNVNDLPDKVKAVSDNLKIAEKKIETLESKLASGKIDEYINNNSTEINGIRAVITECDCSNADELKKLAEALRDKCENTVAVLGCVIGAKVMFVCACDKSAIASGAHAGNIVKQIALIAGGNGGGRPDSAMAGGKDASKLHEALASAPEIISDMIK